MDDTETVSITQLHCHKCEYDWIPRTANLPDVCPRCKNHKWNVPKTADEAGKLSPANQKLVDKLIYILKFAAPVQREMVAHVLESAASTIHPVTRNKKT